MENKRSFWFGLAAGLGATALIGFMIYLWRRKAPAPLNGAFAGVGAPTYILNQAPGGVVLHGAASAPTEAPAPALAQPLKGPTLRANNVNYPVNGALTRTVTVSTEAAPIYYADRDIELTVAMIGPAGAFAFVGVDSDLSDNTSGIFIPAGSYRPIQIRRGQRLYGRGSVDQVTISLSG